MSRGGVTPAVLHLIPPPSGALYNARHSIHSNLQLQDKMEQGNKSQKTESGPVPREAGVLLFWFYEGEYKAVKTSR